MSIIQIAIVIVIAALVLGPLRLSRVGRALGESSRSLRDSILARHDPDDAPAIEPAAPDGDQRDPDSPST